MKSIIEEYKLKGILAHKTTVIKNAIEMGYTDNKQLALLVELPISKIIEIRKDLLINKKE